MTSEYNFQKARETFGDANPPTNYGTYAEGVMAERQRIVNLLMIQHEAAKGVHNYWHVAANLIQAEVGSDT
jgi:hypothetical protein